MSIFYSLSLMHNICISTYVMKEHIYSCSIVQFRLSINTCVTWFVVRGQIRYCSWPMRYSALQFIKKKQCSFIVKNYGQIYTFNGVPIRKAKLEIPCPPGNRGHGCKTPSTCINRISMFSASIISVSLFRTKNINANYNCSSSECMQSTEIHGLWSKIES